MGLANTNTLIAALKIALRKPSPALIPMSDQKRMQSRDYYTAMFEDEQSERGFLVDQIQNNNVIGRWVSYRAEPENATLSLDQLSSLPLEIHQYIGELQILYTSPIEFIWHSRFRIPYLRLLRRRVVSVAVSRKTMLRSNRISILQILIEHVADSYGGKSAEGMMEEIYGKRWRRHPQGEATYHYTVLLLKALTESGELKFDGGRYKITPRAIETIVNHEIEDRRHQDNLIQQRRMVFVTILLVIIGVIQAYQALYNIGLL